MSLELRELSVVAGLQELEPEWWELWKRCPSATPFQSPGWMLPWWRRLWGGGEVWAVALRRDSRLAGLAQMFIWGPPGARRVSLAGSGITDYLDFLMETELAAEGAEMVLDRVMAKRHRWDRCDFQELRAGSPLLEAGTRRGLPIKPCAVCPVLELPGSWEELLAGLSYKFRTDLRRARKRLGSAVLETAGPANLDEMLGALFRLHAARWEGRNQSGMLATAALQGFHCEVAHAFVRAGLLRLLGLRVEGALAAVLYGFAGQDRFYAYLDGFDPALARLSPGTVLMAMAIEGAIGAGLREFDFLRRPEAYKYWWGARDRENLRLELAA